MKLNAEKIKKIFKPAKLCDNCIDFLEKRNHWMLLLIFVALAGYLVFIWHSYIYDYHWSENKKQEYLKTKEKDSVFSRERFGKSVSDVQRRKDEYRKNLEDWPDIFRLK
jgi:hypothetical protein